MEDMAPAYIAFSGRTRGDDGRGYERPPLVTGEITGALETVKPWCVDTREVAMCLHAGGQGRQDYESETLVVGFPGRMSGTQTGAVEGMAPTLGAGNPTAVAFPVTLSNQTPAEGVCPALEAGNGMAVADAAAADTEAEDWAVRRLTPRECERLMGFPDDYTAATGAADTPRYKALGNSIVVPVLRWLGRRMAREMERVSEEQSTTN